MRQFVGEQLHDVRLHPGAIFNDVVGGGVDSALPHGLGDEEKVVTFRQRDDVIDDGSGRRIIRVVAFHGEKPGVDSLRDDDVSQLDVSLRRGQAFLDGFDFLLPDLLNLAIADSVSKDKNLPRQDLVVILVPKE